MKEKKEPIILDFSLSDDTLFSKIADVGKKDPIFMQNLAECIGLVSMIKSITIEEKQIIDKVSVLEEGSIRLIDKPRVIVEERNSINADGTPQIQDGYPVKEWVAIAQTETKVTSIELKDNITLDHAAKILMPLLSGKSKTAYINGQASIKLQNLRNIAEQNKLIATIGIKDVR